MITDIGVDIGKRRLALGWPHLQISYAMDLKKPGRRDLELRQMQAWLVGTVPKNVRLWIEQPYLSNGPGANQTVTIGMAETIGAVKSALPWTEVYEVGQSTWKAQVCGNGRADKAEVALWLETNHPHLFSKTGGDQDRIDSMCIGLYGMLRSTGEIPMPVPKKRKVKKKV